MSSIIVGVVNIIQLLTTVLAIRCMSSLFSPEPLPSVQTRSLWRTVLM